MSLSHRDIRLLDTNARFCDKNVIHIHENESFSSSGEILLKIRIFKKNMSLSHRDIRLLDSNARFCDKNVVHIHENESVEGHRDGPQTAVGEGVQEQQFVLPKRKTAAHHYSTDAIHLAIVLQKMKMIF